MFRKLLSARLAALFCLGATSADHLGYDLSTSFKHSLLQYYPKQALCAAQSEGTTKLPPSKFQKYEPKEPSSILGSSTSLPSSSSTTASLGAYKDGQTKKKKKKKALAKSQIFQQFKKNVNPTVYIFHSHQRPFHSDFISRTFKIFQNLNIPVYTIDEYTENDKQHFHALIPSPKELSTQVHYPVVLFKIGEHVISLDPQKLEAEDGSQYFKQEQRKAFTAQAFNSVADFVALLKRYNKHLSDSVAVVYSKKSAEGMRQECPVAWGVMTHENKAVLITHNAAVAERLKLEQDKYYVYYKPSFLTGHEDFYNRRTQINIEFLQATEALCRDKFTPSKEFLDSSIFKKAMKRSQGLITTGLVQELADKDVLFERSYDTEFILDPEWDAHKIKRITDKPVVVLYMPEMMSQVLVPKLKKAIPKFAGQFYFYYTHDEKKAAQLFPTDDLLGIPYIQILDNTKKVLLKGNEHKILPKLDEAAQLLYDVEYHYKTGKPIKKKASDNSEDKSDPKSLPKAVLRDPSLMESVTYFEELFKLEGIGEEVERFLKQYWSGELMHAYLSPSYKQVAEVKEVNTYKLGRELDSLVQSTNQFVLEAYAPHCGSCQYSGKILNAFSRKLKLHFMQDKLPLFRMNSKNISPIFGRFPYTPMYFYVKFRKAEPHEINEGGEKYVIERVERIPPPLRFTEFKKALLQKAELPDSFQEKIHVHPQEQFQAYYFQKDLKQNFYVDFDVQKAKEEEEKKKAEEKADAQAKESEESEGSKIEKTVEQSGEEKREETEVVREVEQKDETGVDEEKTKGSIEEAKSEDV